MSPPVGASRASIFARQADAIPDSEANQKLIHRWYLSEDTDPFIDQIGSADGTNNGTTQVTGDWVDGAARDGDGTDDYIDTTSLGSFGSNMDTNFAIGLSLQSTGSGRMIGVGNAFAKDDTRLLVALGDFLTAGALGVFIRDGGGDVLSVETSTAGFDDGSEYRFIINKTGNNAGDIELWVNQTERTTTIDQDQAFSNPTNFDKSVSLFAEHNNDGTFGNYMDTVLDDICIFDSSLTHSEIQSYQNPWP
jgi:hypothetical protein